MPFRPLASALHSRLRFTRMALLWLALVLGIAQTVAIRHVYSHAPGESSSTSQGKHPGGVAHCHSCIVAAGIGGGAPPASVLLLAAVGDQQLAIFTAAVDPSAARERPYAIRAPPLRAS